MARNLLQFFTLFSAARLSLALQVTPNSPCSDACRDSLSLDASDPNSSNTRNSDITCNDADYSNAVGTKFKNCMTCLQTSTFSQGTESDIMWFLYNLRYTASYCIFSYPNATGVGSTPCSTSKACGNLRDSVENGIPDPKNMTAYSYCSAGGGEGMASANFDTCVPCVSAGGTTNYLANYLVALEAGCQQQPAAGVPLGLNDTIFSSRLVSIVDPTTLNKPSGSTSSGIGTPAIVGIAAGAVVLLLAAAAVTFMCVRKRRNRRARASAEADFYSRVNARHRSSMSFQCQTHMVSPRFWPGAEEGVTTPVTDSPDVQTHRSSIWKPQDLDYPQQHHDYSRSTPYTTKKAAMTAGPLPQLTTTISPTPPPQAYKSPSSGGGGGGVYNNNTYNSPSDFRSPLSADSARSPSALLTSYIKPYVPSDHGVHAIAATPVQDGNSSTFSSPASAGPVAGGTGLTPLLQSYGWPSPDERRQQRAIRLNDPLKAHPVPPPPPPPLKTSRSSGVLAAGKKGANGKGAGTGSPVESWEIQTAFAAPPKR